MSGLGNGGPPMNGWVNKIGIRELLLFLLLGCTVLLSLSELPTPLHLLLWVATVAVLALIVTRVVRSRAERSEVSDEPFRSFDHDPLTGLYNHRKIQDVLHSLLVQAKSDDATVSVLLFDLDDFKRINCVYGYEVGDEMLRHVVRVLLAECREQDVLGRYGGDEFILILPDTSPEEAERIAARFQTRLNHEPFRFQQYEEALTISVSIGIATYPDDAQSQSLLVEFALRSTEECKRQGSAKIQRVPSYLQIEKRLDTDSHDLEMYILSLKDKDTHTVQHSEDVARYALILAEALHLPESTKRELYTGALFHDIGKILIPDQILKKPGRLTDLEFDRMKEHVLRSDRLLAEHYTSETMKQAVLCHHERYDGKGYPLGLNGSTIPLVGRIMAIADSFSAMTLDRAYRRGKSIEEGLVEMRRCAGTQFDPELVELFCKAIEERKGQM